MKFLLSFLLIFSAITPAFADISFISVRPITLLSAVIVTGAGTAYQVYEVEKTFQACGATSAGAGASAIRIEGCSKATCASTDWVTLGTITLTLSSTNVCDGFASAARWKYVRANVASISGTNAAVTALVGY